MNPNPRPSLQQLTKQVNAWNAHHSTGQPVNVLQDNGAVQATRTRSEAWVMGGHSAVIMLEGLSGSYRLDRVTPTA